jgi:predicted HAD superfamily Cof-like phosphohydrolase
MSKELNQVKEFQNSFGQPILSFKDNISADRARLRLGLILEELHELAIALGEEINFRWQLKKLLEEEPISTPIMSKVSQADALADLEYVVKGTILECGLGDVFDEVFDEVHASNMSKTISEEQIEKEKEILTKSNIDYNMVKTKNNRYIIIRKEDGKVIKPSTYKKADIAGILERFKIKLSAQRPLDI